MFSLLNYDVVSQCFRYVLLIMTFPVRFQGITVTGIKDPEAVAVTLQNARTKQIHTPNLPGDLTFCS